MHDSMQIEFCSCEECALRRDLITDARAYERRALANYKRAQARHLNEQAKGTRDLSVRQTRRMALAVAALQLAAFKHTDAKRRVSQLGG